MDADRDGLDDQLEQALLERFVPALQLSTRECDGQPSEFRPGLPHPQVLARNGTLYGQVFPRTSPAEPGRLIEIHYYHLWSRDCGRAGHSLDAEHVSVLIKAGNHDPEPEDWKALYWYAAAHEDTVCDFSSAAKARDLGAEEHGPPIWISRGKHASFLNHGSCTWGCGGDVCEGTRTLRPARIINVGEPGALANGTEWILSNRWPMAAKLGIDFTDDLIASLGRRKEQGVMTLHVPLRTPQAVLLAGDSTMDALAVSSGKTGGALASAGTSTDAALANSAGKTGSAVARSAKGTGHALRATFRETGRFLGIKRK